MKMDDLQLNISVSKKDNKKPTNSQKNASEYKFASKPAFTGKTIARKRPAQDKKNEEEFQKKMPKLAPPPTPKSSDLSSNLRDLAENKGKFKGKSYQDLSDDIQLKQKPRPGGWISSLFKNNPDVPRIGQRAIKPVVEKVFAGKTFNDLDIHPHSVANLQQNLGLKELMTVQQSAIPIILKGRDALIRSQTGSGKTLAYALPIVEGLQAIRPKINRHDGIRVVVVVPTRELAVQTYELFVKLVKPFTWIVPGLLSGGQKRKAEKARLRKGLSILVGTPGRINDHLRHTQSLNFAKTGCLVLDEADRLLDMGYEKDVAAIVKAIEDHKKNATYDPLAMVKNQVKTTFPKDEEEVKEEQDTTSNEKTDTKHPLTDVFLSKNRQTTLLSATLTKAVENLAGITMEDPVFVDTSEGRAVVADSLGPRQEMQGPSNTIVKESVTTQTKEEVPRDDDESPTNSNNEGLPESKRGLKLFSGQSHSHLFGTDDNTKTSNSNKNTPAAEADDSDSGSDYELMKEHYPETKQSDKVEDEDSDVAEMKPGAFENAIKTALTEDEVVIPASVRQTFLVVPMKLRLVTLCSLIVEHCVINKRNGKVIVFMATLEMVDYHSELIEIVLTGKSDKKKQKDAMKNDNPKAKKRKPNEDNNEQDSSSESESGFEIDYEEPVVGGLVPVALDVFSLHGSMPHEQRIEVFKQFRAAKTGVLFCTDVAARGLDVPQVDLVVQYCAPASATDYVHRVGRTGRATHVGAAVLFLLPSEADFVRHLEQKRIRLRQGDESTVLEALRTVAPAASSAPRAAVAAQARLEHVAHSSRDWLARASRAYTSWVRFYAGYPREVREFLDAKDLHLGHAAKAFALRDTPGALARRAKSDPNLKKERPSNKLTVHEEEEKRRPGFPKVKVGSLGGRIVNKQSSMHTASEFDSGLPPLETANKRKKNKKNK